MSLLRKSFEIIASELENQIQTHILKPGDRLPTIDQLSLQFNVGKSTIREALSQLKARGFIVVKQGDGTFVQNDLEATFSDINYPLTKDPQELYQLLSVRRILEGGCAEIAATSRDEHDLEELHKIINQLKSAVNNEELGRIYDIQFHHTLAKASKNPFMLKLMDTIAETMNLTIRDLRSPWIYRGEKTIKALFQQHLDILLAVEKGEPHAARKAMEAHIDHLREALEEHLKTTIHPIEQ